MVVHTRGVRCNGDMPQCFPRGLDVLEAASKHCSCIATDLGTETFLASNSDPWAVAGVWQMVEQFVVHTQSTSVDRGGL